MNCRLPLLLLTLSAASLSGCIITIPGDWDWNGDWDDSGRHSYIQGNGVDASEQREVEAFDAVRLEDSIDLVARVGEPASITLYGDENLLEHVVTRVRGSSARGFFSVRVSSKRSTIVASAIAPNTSSASSAARQLKMSDSRPPSGALAQAITPRPVSPRDMARAAATGA